MSIVVENLSFGYCTRNVLTDISFTAGDGQLLAILGPNGVGKSTLFRCILGLQSRYKGKISIGGVDAHTLSPREIAHRIAYIPQSHGQAFNYSVMDMVLMGTSHMVSSISAPKKAQMEVAEQALERLGIPHLSQKNFSHLSGGEQQLVLIARALAQQARTLIMDEPTSSLDYGNQVHLLEQVRELADEGYTVLLSTHNPQHALSYGDTALALLNGRTACFGPVHEVLTADMVKSLYGVDVQYLDTDSGSVLIPVIQRQGARHSI